MLLIIEKYLILAAGNLDCSVKNNSFNFEILYFSVILNIFKKAIVICGLIKRGEGKEQR